MCRLIGVILTCLTTSITSLAAADLTRFEARRPQMGTEVVIVIYAADQAQADLAMAAGFSRIATLEKVMSDYDPESELSRLVAATSIGQVRAVSADLWDVLVASRTVSRRTKGAFDITVGPYSRLWRRARRQGEMPDPERLATAAESVGYQFLRLLPRQQAVEFLRAGMRLDLGGIGKGFAADAALQAMQAHGVTIALVDCGGDIVLGDAPPGRAGWKVGIAGVGQGYAEYIVELSGVGVATSGDAFQFVEIDGIRYSHIIHPRTGVGLTSRSSVTVIASNGTDADALASAVSVLGPSEGLRLAARWRGVEAQVLVLKNGQLLRRTTRRFPSAAQLTPTAVY